MDATALRLSDHFLLSDFLGNHSVYSLGLPNVLDENDPGMPRKLANVVTLCHDVLEPIVASQGPVSIGYGFISPSLSRRIVTYQDPDKPSHHRFDLGAAADICVHNWVDSDRTDDGIDTAPISFAHAVDTMGLPYSRLITYSESPYICLAASEQEVAQDKPRRAFYENRYVGVRQPQYKSLSTPSARARALELLEQEGLPYGWRGQGYPSYHGGGRQQMHHRRVSKYCMVSDFLFDLQSIANGAKNVPNVADKAIWNAFCAAGEAYDAILDLTGIRRLPIVAGYVHPANPYFDQNLDWRSGTTYFTVCALSRDWPRLMAIQTDIKNVTITPGDRDDWYNVEVIV